MFSMSRLMGHVEIRAHAQKLAFIGKHGNSDSRFLLLRRLCCTLLLSPFLEATERDEHWVLIDRGNVI